jgi:hypothetical protein
MKSQKLPPFPLPPKRAQLKAMTHSNHPGRKIDNTDIMSNNIHIPDSLPQEQQGSKHLILLTTTAPPQESELSNLYIQEATPCKENTKTSQYSSTCATFTSTTPAITSGTTPIEPSHETEDTFEDAREFLMNTLSPSREAEDMDHKIKTDKLSTNEKLISRESEFPNLQIQQSNPCKQNTNFSPAHSLTWPLQEPKNTLDTSIHDRSVDIPLPSWESEEDRSQETNIQKQPPRKVEDNDLSNSLPDSSTNQLSLSRELDITTPHIPEIQPISQAITEGVKRLKLLPLQGGDIYNLGKIPISLGPEHTRCPTELKFCMSYTSG